MITPAQAAATLLRYSPGSAPITWRQLAPAIGAPSPAAAKRRADKLYLSPSSGKWTGAGTYEYLRRERYPEWPPAGPLVEASMAELLEGRRTSAPRGAGGPLVVRVAQPGDRYRTWDFGRHRRRRDPGDEDSARARTQALGERDSNIVLVAREGRRLVGSTVLRFIDTSDGEQWDIHEVVGPGSIGPIYVDAEHDWGGHAIILESMWVAPDRRRAGIATAMGERVAEIGLPAWGTFRDPWFAAFFLHRWPPEQDIEDAEGSYWPFWLDYVDATDWADESDSAEATVEISLLLSPEEYFNLTDAGYDADEMLGWLLTPYEEHVAVPERGAGRSSRRPRSATCSTTKATPV